MNEKKRSQYFFKQKKHEFENNLGQNHLNEQQLPEKRREKNASGQAKSNRVDG